MPYHTRLTALLPRLCLQDAGSEPAIFKADVMLPYPWSCLGTITTILHANQPMVVFQNFQDLVLHKDGPMPVTIGALRTKLASTRGADMVLDSQHDPILFNRLKEAGVVASRVARVKLINLYKMRDVLLKAGQRPDHVSAIIGIHQNLIPSPVAPQEVTTQPLDAHIQDNVVPEVEMSTQDSAAPSTSRQHLPERPSSSSQPQSIGHVARRWPTTLPELAWPPKALKEDYGLHTIIPEYASDPNIPLGAEVSAFKTWCTQPLHLGRGVMYANLVKEVTFSGAEDTIHALCGFLMKVSHLHIYSSGTTMCW